MVERRHNISNSNLNGASMVAGKGERLETTKTKKEEGNDEDKTKGKTSLAHHLETGLKRGMLVSLACILRLHPINIPSLLPCWRYLRATVLVSHPFCATCSPKDGKSC